MIIRVSPSIFYENQQVLCREPDEEDDAVTLIPEAVIEVVSRGSEMKDLELNPPFYLSRGIKDVVVANPG